jgi:hypothetical protein
MPLLCCPVPAVRVGAGQAMAKGMCSHWWQAVALRVCLCMSGLRDLV